MTHLMGSEGFLIFKCKLSSLAIPKIEVTHLGLVDAATLICPSSNEVVQLS
ncbi:MAG: hypothetical protein AAF871_09880 [Pseudomonadota bacterium]